MNEKLLVLDKRSIIYSKGIYKIKYSLIYNNRVTPQIDYFEILEDLSLVDIDLHFQNYVGKTIYALEVNLFQLPQNNKQDLRKLAV
jgi:hypothetical protein